METVSGAVTVRVSWGGGGGYKESVWAPVNCWGEVVDIPGVRYVVVNLTYVFSLWP